jgi:murein DD-endopeptidase MepM/ murein hydrolase activator NlpD
MLAIVPATEPLYDDTAPATPQNPIQLGLALASEQMQVMRERANVLLGPVDSAGGLALDDAALHSSRRAAAKWVSRYATHLVILAIVLALVAFGGFRSLTSVSAYPNGLQPADAYAGTDAFGGDSTDNGDATDSLNYNITLPRTELGSTDAAADSKVAQPGANGDQNAAPQAPVSTTVTAYTVVQGDTVQSVAARFQVMPETVMGSNGIFDSQQDLTAGQVLQIPPIDGMYYVPAANDTLDTISRHFQIDPEVVKEYPPNNMADGVLKPGVPIVVPGGMMPQREVTVVYTVKPGDTLKDIAARYGIDVPTMIRSNTIPNPDSLQIGSQLRVLPVSGMEYKVQKGDTLNSIADKLGVSTQMILDYSPNNLNVNSTLQIDQVIMVPGGSPQEAPVVVADRVAPASRPAQPQAPSAGKSTGGTNPPAQSQPRQQPKAPQLQQQPPAPAPAPPAQSSGSYVGSGAPLTWPVNGVITQYFTASHNGLDIAISAGTPIHAADSGKVVWAGWRTDGLGYCVIIDHLNGLVTVYGHQIRQPAVVVGQYVSRGQVIGWVGSTGHSTGPHVHFMVKIGMGHNYQNPLRYLGSR